MRFFSLKNIIIVSFILLITMLFVVLDIVYADNVNSYNYRNVTVQSYVNITNSGPDIINMTIFQDTNATLRNITLSAGSERIVVCNATVRDWNGYGDIINVSAKLWDVSNSAVDAADDNNTHYTNTNCTFNSSTGLYTANYICNFSVYYYANNGTWNCSVSAWDNLSMEGNLSNSTFFYTLYALNITQGINYGNVALDDYSLNTTANVTNFGNVPINITVEGYGVVKGDGLAMGCQGGNITVDNEHFSSSDVAWSSMAPLTSSSQGISGVTISKTTNSEYLSNSTYWQLYTNSTNNPGGNCTGYVIFSATAS